MDRRGGQVLGGALIAALLIASVAGVAAYRARDPARCPDGLVALGPRCCGEGQRLDDNRCVGAAARCNPPLAPTPLGCVPPAQKVHVEAGTLRTGPGDWEAVGTVARDVAVPAFDIDAFEVTEDRYASCVAAHACAAIALSGEPGVPATRITRDEAAAFCAWAGGALPSAEQLAFAAAGPTGRRYPWGDTGAVCRRVAWGLRSGPCSSGAAGPELAGSRPDGATPSHVFDLAGNVSEWTRSGDAYAEVRGGSWADTAAASLRTWSRRQIASSTRSSEIGFRCVYGG